MARIVGLDFGTKKCGIAATDPLQIIVSAVGTIQTAEIYIFFENYMKTEDVEKLVIGLPKHRDGTETFLKKNIDVFAAKMKKSYPQLDIDFEDERMTSVEAKDIILKSGVKKSKRRDKTLVDKVSAVLILQRYLGHF